MPIRPCRGLPFLFAVGLSLGAALYASVSFLRAHGLPSFCGLPDFASCQGNADRAPPGDFTQAFAPWLPPPLSPLSPSAAPPQPRWPLPFGIADGTAVAKVRSQPVQRFVADNRQILRCGSTEQRLAAINLIAATAGGAGRTAGENAGALRERLCELAPDLIALTRDKEQGPRSGEVQAAAARALGELEAEPAEVIPALEDVLRCGNVSARRAAVVALDKVLPSRRVTLERLRTMHYILGVLPRGLRDSDAAVRLHVAGLYHRIACALLEAASLHVPAPSANTRLDAQTVALYRDSLSLAEPLFREAADMQRTFRRQAGFMAVGAGDSSVQVQTEICQALETVAQAERGLGRVDASIQQLKKRLPPTKARPSEKRASGGQAQKKGSLEASETVAEPAGPRAGPSPPGMQADDDRPDVLPPPRPATEEGLSSYRKAYIRAAIPRLRDPSIRVRLTALGILEGMGRDAEEAVPDLIPSLFDCNRFVRWQTAQIIGRLAPFAARQAVPALMLRLNEYEDSQTRLAACIALRRYAQLDPATAAQAVPLLAAVLHFGEMELRLQVLETIRTIGRPAAARALPSVAWAVKIDKDGSVRAAAARVLGFFGELSRPAVPTLRKAMKDDDPEVRRAASEAILAIEPVPQGQ